MKDTSNNYERVQRNMRPLRSKRSATEVQNDMVLMNLQGQVVTARYYFLVY